MRYFQNKFVVFFAAPASALVYFVLRDFSFAIDAALCVSFTILVFGNALRRRGRRFVAGEDGRSIAEILLAHAVCLVTLVMILRTAMFASMLPDWLIIPVCADHYGRFGPSTFQMMQWLALFFLGYLEVLLLTAPKVKDPEKEEARAIAALWKKAGPEAERLDPLRLP